MRKINHLSQVICSWTTLYHPLSSPSLWISGEYMEFYFGNNVLITLHKCVTKFTVESNVSFCRVRRKIIYDCIIQTIYMQIYIHTHKSTLAVTCVQNTLIHLSKHFSIDYEFTVTLTRIILYTVHILKLSYKLLYFYCKFILTTVCKCRLAREETVKKMNIYWNVLMIKQVWKNEHYTIFYYYIIVFINGPTKWGDLSFILKVGWHFFMKSKCLWCRACFRADYQPHFVSNVCESVFIYPWRSLKFSQEWEYSNSHF